MAAIALPGLCLVALHGITEGRKVKRFSLGKILKAFLRSSIHNTFSATINRNNIHGRTATEADDATTTSF